MLFITTDIVLKISSMFSDLRKDLHRKVYNVASIEKCKKLSYSNGKFFDDLSNDFKQASTLPFNELLASLNSLMSNKSIFPLKL